MFSAVKLSRKLALGFALVVSLMLVYGAYSFTAYQTMASDINELAKNWLPSIKTISQITEKVGRYRRLEFQHILATEDAAMQGFEGELEKTLSDLGVLNKNYEALISSPGEREVFKRYETAWASYLDIHKQLIALSRKNATEQARTLMAGDSRTASAAVLKELDQLVAINDKGAADQAADGLAASARAKLVAIICLTLATLVATRAWPCCSSGASWPSWARTRAIWPRWRARSPEAT